MDVPRRLARSRILVTSLAAAVFSGLSGCSQWALSPSDLWPSKETWEKLSPSNLWYEMQPTRLSRLNEGSPGMPSDVYYSVPDPLTSERDSAAVVEPVSQSAASAPAADAADPIVRP